MGARREGDGVVSIRPWAAYSTSADGGAWGVGWAWSGWSRYASAVGGLGLLDQRMGRAGCSVGGAAGLDAGVGRVLDLR
jgi:hypothetical protein